MITNPIGQMPFIFIRIPSREFCEGVSRWNRSMVFLISNPGMKRPSIKKREIMLRRILGMSWQEQSYAIIVIIMAICDMKRNETVFCLSQRNGSIMPDIELSRFIPYWVDVNHFCSVCSCRCLRRWFQGEEVAVSKYICKYIHMYRYIHITHICWNIYRW